MSNIFTKKEITNLVLSTFATIVVICLSIFLIWNFFKDYEYAYLLAGILLPIFMMLLSSQYCAGTFISLIMMILGVLGYYYLNDPYKLIALSFSIYMAMFKIMRIVNNLEGNYIDKDILKNNDLCYLHELLNSDWYQENKDISSYEIQTNSLINQEFHQEYVNNIINVLVQNNVKYFSESVYSKDTLLRIHAIGIIKTLPIPISKNADGVISVGTQLLLNIFSNLKTINYMKSIDITDDNFIISSSRQLINNSLNEFGPVSINEIEEIKNNKLISSRFNLLK
jgi:hypothetical protein